MLLGIWHISWTVSDLERSKAFYATLGFELIHYQEQKNEYTEKFVGLPGAHLKAALMKFADTPPGLSGHVIELIEYVSPKGMHLHPRPCDINSAHLAVITNDVQELHQRMLAAGASFVSPPVAITAGINQGGFTCYMRDSDGFTVELMQPPRWRLDRGQSCAGRS
jgi:catechol 2,3-dioxygenase-like lactoylglutathione lyase family enzyme